MLILILFCLCLCVSCNLLCHIMYDLRAIKFMFCLVAVDVVIISYQVSISSLVD